MAKKKSGDGNGAVAEPQLEPLEKPAAPPTEKAQPIHTIRMRNVRAACWKNIREADGTPRVEHRPVTITRWPPGERVYGR